jgi:hypothetical protein
MTAQPLVFDVYGYRFSVQGHSQSAVDGIGHDFAFFRAEATGDEVTIKMVEQAPDYDGLPVCGASVYTPRNTVYRSGGRAYIDYHGRGLGVHEPAARSFQIISRDPHLLYEATYLFLLSQIGAALDEKRLHRVHAMGVSVNGRAVLALLPMGGGKSTLGDYLLRYPEVKLLSDDSPFIGADGRVHAFPLHLGLLAGSEGEIPERHRRYIERMEFDPKYLVNYEYFAHRVVASAEPGIVFLGSRTLARDCRIEPASMTAGLRTMMSNCVIGLGLFQGLEFVLESSPWELLGKARVGWSRLTNCHRLLRRSRIYHLYLGRDLEKNAASVLECARSLPG